VNLLNIMIGLTISNSYREPNKRNEGINFMTFNTFLEDIKMDYENASQSLRTALDKFKKRYNAAKSKSIFKLISFLYDLNNSLDPMCVKSGIQIRVQVKSVKRHKQKGSTKRSLSVPTNRNKKNLDSHVILTEKREKSVKRIII